MSSTAVQAQVSNSNLTKTCLPRYVTIYNTPPSSQVSSCTQLPQSTTEQFLYSNCGNSTVYVDINTSSE
jgi:predicted acyl esterase